MDHYHPEWHVMERILFTFMLNEIWIYRTKRTIIEICNSTLHSRMNFMTPMFSGLLYTSIMVLQSLYIQVRAYNGYDSLRRRRRYYLCLRSRYYLIPVSEEMVWIAASTTIRCGNGDLVGCAITTGCLYTCCCCMGAGGGDCIGQPLLASTIFLGCGISRTIESISATDIDHALIARFLANL